MLTVVSSCSHGDRKGQHIFLVQAEHIPFVSGLHLGRTRHIIVPIPSLNVSNVRSPMESLYIEGKHLVEDRLISQEYFQMWGRGSFPLIVLQQRLEPHSQRAQGILRFLPDRLGPESSSSTRVKSIMGVFWIQKPSTKPPISVLQSCFQRQMKCQKGNKSILTPNYFIAVLQAGCPLKVPMSMSWGSNVCVFQND